MCVWFYGQTGIIRRRGLWAMLKTRVERNIEFLEKFMNLSCVRLDGVVPSWCWGVFAWMQKLQWRRRRRGTFVKTLQLLLLKCVFVYVCVCVRVSLSFITEIMMSYLCHDKYTWNVFFSASISRVIRFNGLLLGKTS